MRDAFSKDDLDMWILVAEALGALGLFLFIVWWTFGPAQRRDREAMSRLAREEADRRIAEAPAADAAKRPSASR